MTSTFNATKTLTNQGWVVTGYISAGGTLPVEIFMYENSGVTTLGTYVGIIAAIDIPRIQIFTGTALPIFGNKYVRSGTATVLIGNNDPDNQISIMVASIKSLSIQYQALQSASSVYTIP